MHAQTLKIALSGALLALLLACGGNGAPPDQSNAGDDRSSPKRESRPGAAGGSGASSALAPGSHDWTTSDDNTMPYEISGNAGAATTVLFVHCWMCERRYWDDQLPALASDYRTITVDLPGHGRASSDRATWSVAQFGDDVAELMRDLDLRSVVLVGHSMGGPVALRAAALSEGRVLGIVAVDTLHDAEFSFGDATKSQILRAFEMNYVNSCQQMTRQMFPEPGVESIVQRVSAVACREEKAAIGSALMRDFATIDLREWFREAGVPIRGINAASGRATEFEINRKYSDFDAVLMEGVGHYPQLTRPDEFNPLLLASVRELAGESD